MRRCKSTSRAAREWGMQMITVAYIGFGVSVREYHIPYVENRDDIKVKYVYRRQEDIAQFAEYLQPT